MPAKPTPRSLVLVGHHADQSYRFRLTTGGNSVGSHRDNQVCLDISGVSKRHAVIRLTADQMSVEDLASKNGTYVNGRRIQQAKIKVDDQLTFASVCLAVEKTRVEDGRLAVSLESPPSADGESAFQETPFVDRTSQCTPSPAHFGDLTFPPSWLPGKSVAMTALFSQVHAIARSALPVLILGETGVGKEGLAQTLHLSSPRAAGPFVAINCAAIPEALLEAELFGIGAGVATGVKAREGRFSAARGGTLFLDEIGDMPATLQAKLLRVLQEGEVQPLGRGSQALDVRVIAATHNDFDAALAAGRFRRDLFYRLAGIALHFPPLRQRREDIPGLVAHFMSAATRNAAKDVRGLTMEAMQLLIDHPWPGNTRQLKHAVERWVHLCPSHQVIDAHLVAEDLTATFESVPALPVDDAAAEADRFDLANLSSLNLLHFEEQLVREALRRSGGNITKAAEALGLTRQALRRRLERHDLLSRKRS